MSENNAVLTTHDLSIGYREGGDEKVIRSGIDVALHAGELVCLLGPNGAGKSTLLRTLAGMQPALGGQVCLLGRDVRHQRPRELARRLSVVLTDRITAGGMLAYDLVALGRYPHTGWMGQLRERDHAMVRWAIHAAGADALADRPVGELSDGERQKVMIARALAQEPAAVLLDEPTAFLDLPHRVEAMRTLRDLARRAGQAILLSTHDLDLALRSADRIWLMARGEPLRVGAPEDLVLSGAFEATFRREGVAFDADTGAFAIEQPTAGTVHLTGEGRPALWTRRALERAGYRVTRNGTPAEVRVRVTNGSSAPRWEAETPSRTLTHDSIHDLLASLEAHTAPPA